MAVQQLVWRERGPWRGAGFRSSSIRWPWDLEEPLSPSVPCGLLSKMGVRTVPSSLELSEVTCKERNTAMCTEDAP